MTRTNPSNFDVNIQRAGRSWSGPEALERFSRTPRKIEMIDGRLFYSDEQRLAMLALLLENLGADAAVRLGDPAVWRAAVADLDAAAPPAPALGEVPKGLV